MPEIACVIEQMSAEYVVEIASPHRLESFHRLLVHSFFANLLPVDATYGSKYTYILIASRGPNKCTRVIRSCFCNTFGYRR